MDQQIQQKAWGTSTALVRDKAVHVDRISVLPGGYCSIHRHLYKSNIFHVLSGRFCVQQFAMIGGRMATRWLLPGDSFTYTAGQWHQFWAGAEGAEALELYVPSAGVEAVDAADIERLPALEVGGTGNYQALTQFWAEAFPERTACDVPAALGAAGSSY